MIFYKDKVFCTRYEYCRHGKTCNSALTKKVILAAKIWWGQENE